MLGAPEVIGTLVDTGRGFIFDTGLAPPCAGAALAALEVVAAEPGLGARARAAATRLAAIGRACLRLTGRASLTESEFAAAARALAAVGGHDES